jgi:hypothetical protein
VEFVLLVDSSRESVVLVGSPELIEDISRMFGFGY